MAGAVTPDVEAGISVSLCNVVVAAVAAAAAAAVQCMHPRNCTSLLLTSDMRTVQIT